MENQLHKGLSEMSTAYAIVSFIQKFSWILVVAILIFGWTSPSFMLIAFLCMIGPIAFSFFYGRAWCGNFCPRGSFSGAVLSIISPNKPVPKQLKSPLFRILMFTLLMMLFVNNLYQSHGTLYGIGIAFIKMMAITTVMQIGFAIFIHPHAWCAFCPMGTVAYCITKMKGRTTDSIKISSNCISCNACSKNCPMQIDIPSWQSVGEVKDADCMKCRKCIKYCSQTCLKYE